MYNPESTTHTQRFIDDTGAAPMDRWHSGCKDEQEYQEYLATFAQPSEERGMQMLVIYVIVAAIVWGVVCFVWLA